MFTTGFVKITFLMKKDIENSKSDTQSFGSSLVPLYYKPRPC